MQHLLRAENKLAAIQSGRGLPRAEAKRKEQASLKQELKDALEGWDNRETVCGVRNTTPIQAVTYQDCSILVNASQPFTIRLAHARNTHKPRQPERRTKHGQAHASGCQPLSMAATKPKHTSTHGGKITKRKHFNTARERGDATVTQR